MTIFPFQVSYGLWVQYIGNPETYLLGINRLTIIFNRIIFFWNYKIYRDSILSLEKQSMRRKQSMEKT